MQEVLDVSNEVAAELAGLGDHVLETLRDRLECTIRLRGNQLTLEGDAAQIEEARAVIGELVELVEGGHSLAAQTVDAVIGARGSAHTVRDVLDDVVWRHRGKQIAPMTVTQKAYVDAIRRCTLTFGIGPAGTGKTYLAMALAVSALQARQVARIILTRPAVEAGERLGFLPGDMLAKVDPYLRPLFDALYDMLDPDRANTYMERGTIEVAPLAFMRGRAQPLASRVLTPEGFASIGDLRVGDLVVGSDGRPTVVLGVYPQGRRPVYRLSTQDGASTLCCAEHLWLVATPEGSARVLETRELIERLRAGGGQRDELPLLSAPAELEPRALPIEPYALGLLLGEQRASPLGAQTSSREPVAARARALEPVLRSGDDRRAAGAGRGLGRGAGAVTAEPPTFALALAGVPPRSTSIPRAYLANGSAPRIDLLQGLLDGGDARVVRRGGSRAIEFTTCSPRLADELTELVRSLGGVACRRGRDGAQVLELRLPAGIRPFRRAERAGRYDRAGAGRPLRVISSIEPAGEEQTVCIQVAAADSLYVTDDYLLTHNTLNDSFIILDEAQNTSPEQMQMFLTRLGFGSRIVVTGDVTQIDLPRDQASGLIQVQGILDGIDGIAFIRFGHQDVVRHQLVQRIVEAYREHAEETGTERRR